MDNSNNYDHLLLHLQRLEDRIDARLDKIEAKMESQSTRLWRITAIILAIGATGAAGSEVLAKLGGILQ